MSPQDVLAALLADHPAEFRHRVARRLTDERVVWLTTVNRHGLPAPNPVWFLWDGSAVLVHHDRGAHRLAHLHRQPGVVLHFDGGSAGRDVVVIEGRAGPVQDTTRSGLHPAYLAKYAEGMEHVFGGVESFHSTHAQLTRIDPVRIRGR